MSKKTIFKRIALTAVSALAAGSLAVISVPVANAANNGAAGDANAVSSNSTLNIATLATTSGAVTVTNTSTATSIGLVAVSDTAGGSYPGTTQTATLLSTGTITVYTETNSTYEVIAVENGTIVNSANAEAVNSAATAIVATGADEALIAAIRPVSGATTMTIRQYSGAASVWSSTAATAVALPSLGTLVGQITVTVAKTSEAGVLSSATSGAYWGTSSIIGATTITSDVAGQNSTDYGRALYLEIRARDAYSQALAAGGLLIATATGGAFVDLNPTNSSSRGTAATDFVSSAPDTEDVLIHNPTSNPIAGTVTITLGGVVIATKSYGFSGKVAKITLSSPVIGKTGGTGNKATYTLADAAGNAVYVDYSGSDNSTTPPSGFAEDLNVTSGSATGVTVNNRDYSINTTTGVVTTGRVEFTCSSTAGNGKIAVTYTNTDGSMVKSNVLDVKCAGDAVSYKASYDKAVYAPGEIATLTLTFYDAKGNVANDITDVDSDGASGEITVSTGGMSQTVSGPSDTGASGADIDQGKLVFKYAVSTTEGTFTNVINVPDVNEAATSAAISGTGAVSATFTVKAASTAVTTNEVLAAIVKLIATINKQIRQLQKQLRR